MRCSIGCLLSVGVLCRGMHGSVGRDEGGPITGGKAREGIPFRAYYAVLFLLQLLVFKGQLAGRVWGKEKQGLGGRKIELFSLLWLLWTGYDVMC
jgi:hypothetical protein